MWQILEAGLRRLRARRAVRRVESLLKRIGRGEVRRDGLRLDKISHRLEIEWRARGIHPWDRTLSFERRSLAFVNQTFADTEAAILRLFDELPHVDVIDMAVLEPESGRRMMAGTVRRSEVADVGAWRSVKMRLSRMGVRYHLAGTRFEVLDSDPD